MKKYGLIIAAILIVLGETQPASAANQGAALSAPDISFIKQGDFVAENDNTQWSIFSTTGPYQGRCTKHVEVDNSVGRIYIELRQMGHPENSQFQYSCFYAGVIMSYQCSSSNPITCNELEKNRDLRWDYPGTSHYETEDLTLIPDGNFIVNENSFLCDQGNCTFNAGPYSSEFRPIVPRP